MGKCSSYEVDCAQRGFASPQRVCLIYAEQKHALLIAQTSLVTAQRQIGRKNYEATLSATRAGLSANYTAPKVVDAAEAAKLHQAVAKLQALDAEATAAKHSQDQARAQMREQLEVLFFLSFFHHSPSAG